MIKFTITYDDAFQFSIAIAVPVKLSVAGARLRDLGITIGRQQPGPFNTITDVADVRVGYVTLNFDSPAVARTGVTAIVPTRGPYWSWNLFAGFHCFNGFGEVTGGAWIQETGLLTCPILLTSTFSIGVARDTMLAHPMRAGFPERFHQPICGETNDGVMNDGLAQHVAAEHIIEALENAHSGPLAEGNVGGGTGMICHEFKGGTGTASRICPTGSGNFMVGVLVQANYGVRRDLSIDGVPVGREIHYEVVPSPRRREAGSIVVIIATDAPLLPTQCARLARRGALGLGRSGGFGGNTSGDFVICFSTANQVPAFALEPTSNITMIPNEHMNPLFQGAVEATEEAIANSLIAAETMIGRAEHTAHAIPHDLLVEAMARHGRLPAIAGVSDR